MLLVDTCVLLWLAADPSHIPPRIRHLLENNRSALFVSAISAFEIGVKHQRGGLRLPLRPSEWFAAVAQARGVKEIAVTGQIAARSTELPKHHRDPADRIIVATAAEHRLTIVTPDPLIAAYKEATSTWA